VSAATQFPEVPNFKSAPMKLSAEIFNHFIQNTAFAITNEQSRFTLSGAKFMIDGGTARMVTTDGHRLALSKKRKEATENDGRADSEKGFDGTYENCARCERRSQFRRRPESYLF
jgi:DNA polymerase III sliding clamp (beta) subunit (PCNA family)